MKKTLRTIVAKASSYMEIFISVLLLVGISIATINLATELIGMSKVALASPDVTLPIEEYLATGLQLIIGVEFIKMIAKHTVGSAIDVLLFAIARKLVISHGSALDLLLGIIAIAILFIIKHYFGNKCEKGTSIVKKEEVEE
ncbi:hypothetical protein CS063_00240 [Sporanaerobium hydrogeniformans]|uniref:Uncharacterized protein n=1 Tax=Sporanaerobium hydrogeniformans TaxID=3072179 RepID=A0AC61DFB3_9FIRM|nr:hypothetical protein [Sporanaerobium hydrogeniformans]PHV71940.1 hypothetical protein CS063_00240 [Sporanaerobium hydrogeniformans]